MLNWTKHGNNPIIRPGENGFADRNGSSAPCVLIEKDTYIMYYWGKGADGKYRICKRRASIDDPANWTYMGIALEPGPENAFDCVGPVMPYVVRVDDKILHMYYVGWGPDKPDNRLPNNMGLAISSDNGKTWERYSEKPILPLGMEGSFDEDLIGSMCVFYDNTSNTWRMWYSGGRYTQLDNEKEVDIIAIGYATSKDGINWTKYVDNPVMKPYWDKVYPFENLITKPTVLNENGIYKMWYGHLTVASRAYILGYAESYDGINWIRMDDRIGIHKSKSGWDSEMIEYASIVKHKDEYRMWYCGNGFGDTGIGYASCKVDKSI